MAIAVFGQRNLKAVWRVGWGGKRGDDGRETCSEPELTPYTMCRSENYQHRRHRDERGQGIIPSSSITCYFKSDLFMII